ncbi:MAG: hypothetical protein FWD15_05640 [Alphaproteobacteria bacterium]|nr:hypothetical protein [Alphaproteobacteria bacterium]
MKKLRTAATLAVAIPTLYFGNKVQAQEAAPAAPATPRPAAATPVIQPNPPAARPAPAKTPQQIIREDFEAAISKANAELGVADSFMIYHNTVMAALRKLGTDTTASAATLQRALADLDSTRGSNTRSITEARTKIMRDTVAALARIGKETRAIHAISSADSLLMAVSKPGIVNANTLPNRYAQIKMVDSTLTADSTRIVRAVSGETQRLLAQDSTNHSKEATRLKNQHATFVSNSRTVAASVVGNAEQARTRLFNRTYVNAPRQRSN